jgi:hypothetical protein
MEGALFPRTLLYLHYYIQVYNMPSFSDILSTLTESQLQESLNQNMREIREMNEQLPDADASADIDRLATEQSAIRDEIKKRTAGTGILRTASGPGGYLGLRDVPPYDIPQVTEKYVAPSIIKASRHFQGEPTAYSGCDIIPIITTGTGEIVALGSLQGLSYSIHRAKPPVRVLGRSYPKSYARSQRTIAGTLIWLVFDQYALSEITNIYEFELASDSSSQTMVPDQLPPFDITVTYWSEAPGADGEFVGSYLRLYGVEITDEGQSNTVNDMYPENVMQFVARDIDHLVPNDNYVESSTGELKKIAPFQRALFQSNFSNTSNTTSSDFSNQIKILMENASTLSYTLLNMNASLREYDRRPDSDSRKKISIRDRETGNILTIFDSREELVNNINKISNDIKGIEKRIESIRARMDENQTRNSIDRLRAGSLSRRDTPFDSVTPRRF